MIGCVIVVVAAIFAGAISNQLWQYPALNKILPQTSPPSQTVTQKIVKEESIVIDVVEKNSPTVVTVSLKTTQKTLNLNPSDPFSFFNTPQEEEIEQNVGTGFVIKPNLILTNRHVVNNLEADYQIITADNKTHPVENIYRDPSNDLAILKVNQANLPAIELGNSDNLKVGQFVIAIGTALGEFRHTVTTGVISGLGRGVTAGSPYQGYIEQLDNVIQTDAAINPGNSGGPLLNSDGQVIGVNVAVAQGAENIGFAIPINIVKEMLANFEETGKFTRPYLGVSYSEISKEAAILNEIPQGAYIVKIVPNSPAVEAGLKQGDIITEVSDQTIKEAKDGLSQIINQKQVGETVELKVWRDGEYQTIPVTLKARE